MINRAVVAFIGTPENSLVQRKINGKFWIDLKFLLAP